MVRRLFTSVGEDDDKNWIETWPERVPTAKSTRPRPSGCRERVKMAVALAAQVLNANAVFVNNG